MRNSPFTQCSRRQTLYGRAGKRSLYCLSSTEALSSPRPEATEKTFLSPLLPLCFVYRRGEDSSSVSTGPEEYSAGLSTSRASLRSSRPQRTLPAVRARGWQTGGHCCLGRGGVEIRCSPVNTWDVATARSLRMRCVSLRLPRLPVGWRFKLFFGFLRSQRAAPCSLWACHPADGQLATYVLQGCSTSCVSESGRTSKSCGWFSLGDCCSKMFRMGPGIIAEEFFYWLNGCEREGKTPQIVVQLVNVLRSEYDLSNNSWLFICGR